MEARLKKLLGDNGETEIFLANLPDGIGPESTNIQIVSEFNDWRKTRQRKMDESAVQYLGNTSCLTGLEAMALGNARARLWRNNY